MVTSKCRGCQAEIIWIKTTGGKNMPCDPEKITIVTEAGETHTGYIPHWATCKKSKDFKKDKPKKSKEQEE